MENTSFILSPQLRDWILTKHFETLKEAMALEYLGRESTSVRKPINKSLKICFKCNRMGHTADRCFSANIPRINFPDIPRDRYYKPQNIQPIRDNFIRPNAQSQGTMLCTHCGGRNHNIKSCYKLRSAVKCTYCGKNK